MIDGSSKGTSVGILGVRVYGHIQGCMYLLHTMWMRG